MIFYLDTSLLVSALTNEPRTTEMQVWLASQPAGQLAISDWVMTEFSGALSIKLRMGQLSEAQRADVLATFTQLVNESFVVLPVSHTDFQDAARYADQYATGLRSADALHLAVAANHGIQIQSLDHGLVQAANALGVSAILL